MQNMEMDNEKSLSLAYESEPLGSLHQTISHSSHLTPMNKLSVELLLVIFDIVFYTNDPNRPTSSVLQCPPNQLHDLSCVCSHWRNIIINIPRLWSLINFNGPRGLDRTALWLQRAGEALLSIEMNSARLEILDPQIHIPRQLEPYMRRVSNFTLEAPADVMNPIIRCWLLHGAPSRLASLQLSYPKGLEPINYPLDSSRVTPERLNLLLDSVVTLRLHGVYFDWTLCNFGGLTTLELAFLGFKTTPTLDQLVRILSASPALQALHLVSVVIYPKQYRTPSGVVEVSLVSLPFLESLELSLISGRLHSLLSLLQPGARPLELRLNLTTSNRTVEQEAIVAFLSRSNVKTLHVGQDNSSCDRWFSYLPQLEILHAVGQWTMEEVWDTISPIPTGGMAPASFNCPKLHTVNLQGCYWSRTDSLQRLLKSHSIQSFTVCQKFAENFGSEFNRPFGEWMSKVAPNVAASIEPSGKEYNGFMPRTWW
ncbi:hypothetical protein BDV93DRAFT_609341 [Ceratobasidium sp. AG-I]|nr:hypothetical protein BDV93DRAFT_609341 [Ceratobasidium sp. AG-I]